MNPITKIVTLLKREELSADVGMMYMEMIITHMSVKDSLTLHLLSKKFSRFFKTAVVTYRVITYLLQVLYKYNFELNTLDDVQQSCFICSILKCAIMHSSCMLNQYTDLR